MAEWEAQHKVCRGPQHKTEQLDKKKKSSHQEEGQSRKTVISYNPNLAL